MGKIFPHEEKQFSKWRALFWPVYQHELKKLIPMLLMFFLITFSYNVLRVLKDTLVVMAKGSGAEVIPFLKVWAMLPGAILMTYLFTRLSNRISSDRVIYIILSGFLAYFLFFVFVLYPARNYLHPQEFADSLQSMLPLGCKGFVAMIRNWTFTSFYVMSELWSNIVLSLLFWGFANQVTEMHEAKRFYGIFGIGVNFSGIVAGFVSGWISSQAFLPFLPYGNTPWEQQMMTLIFLVVLSGLIAMSLLYWINCNKVKKNDLKDSANTNLDKKTSFIESIKLLTRSRYLICIALIVLCYNIIINLSEVVWKDEVRKLCPTREEYNLYMSNITMVIGIFATFSSYFFSGNLIRKCGWTFTALITPLILFLTSFIFFGAYFFKDQLALILPGLWGMTPLALVVFCGSLQNVLSRAAKYTVYDATKEMAFIPLPHEEKVKGKAIVDGVCSRLGKSGGALIHQSLLLTFSTIAASSNFVAGFLFGFIGIWTMATRVLGVEFNLATSQGELQEKPITTQDLVVNAEQGV